jgi:hypothetical protein
VSYAVDASPAKHGRTIGGVRVPILAPSTLAVHLPATVLVLVWDLRAEVEAQLAEYLDRGGTLLFPLPTVELVARAAVTSHA